MGVRETTKNAKVAKVRLGDVAWIDGRIPFPDGEKVWLLNLDMIEQQSGRLISKNIVARSEVSSSTVGFDENCVLYSKLRPNLNKVLIPTEPGVATSEILPLRHREDVLGGYLCCYLRSPAFVSYAVGRTAGAKMPRLSSKDLLAAQFPLPPFPEQKRIAEELDRICELKKNAEERLALMDQLVKSRFVEMFGDQKNYAKVRVDEVFSVGGPKRIHKEEWTNEGVPFLKISDLMNRLENGIRTADCYISKMRYDELKAANQVPKAGDVLVTARGTLGRCYVVDAGDEFYFQDGMITWLSEKRGNIDLTYFLAAVQMPEFRRQYEGKSAGTTVAYLTIGQLAKFQLPLPPIGEQRKFAAFVAEVDKSKSILRETIAQMETLYKAKLQEYFG